MSMTSLIALVLTFLIMWLELSLCSDHQVCGWSSADASISFDEYIDSGHNRQSDKAGCSENVHSRSGVKTIPSVNKWRICPDYFKRVNWTRLSAPEDTAPLLRYESGCQCNSSMKGRDSADLKLRCTPVRLPVSSLETAGGGGGRELRLVTRLLGAGCATLHSLRSPKPPIPEPLTGSAFKKLNDMLVGSGSLYGPVSCQLASTQSQPQFIINADSRRVPRLLPDVRCPCGQRRVELPFWELRRTDNGEELEQTLGSIGVSCAVPAP